MKLHMQIRIFLALVLGCGAVPVIAGTTDAASLEARVDRLMWQLVNDERYSHLQVPANYERLRGALLEQACLVAAAPCAALDKMPHAGRTMTTEITPEQLKVIEQLLFSLHSASAELDETPVHLMVTAVP